jgi:hypothetical protein
MKVLFNSDITLIKSKQKLFRSIITKPISQSFCDFVFRLPKYTFLGHLYWNKILQTWDFVLLFFALMNNSFHIFSDWILKRKLDITSLNFFLNSKRYVVGFLKFKSILAICLSKIEQYLIESKQGIVLYHKKRNVDNSDDIRFESGLAFLFVYKSKLFSLYNVY